MYQHNKDELQEAIEKLDMRSYLDREGLEYREKTGISGDQLNLKVCPACGDEKWRTWINASSGLGNCFHGSCQIKFNKYKFIAAHLGNPAHKDVIEHIKAVSAEQGWRPKTRSRELVKPLVVECKLPTRCIRLPDINGNTLTYLVNRGVGPELCERFGLLYCHDGKYSYENAIGEREDQYYGGRIIFPVADLQGRIVTFQGRDISGESTRKYLFPPGLPASGLFLYGAHLVKGQAEIAVGEGVFDAIALHSAFQRNPDLQQVGAVATFGMHLSDRNGNDQVGMFLKLRDLGLKRITFMWDSEPKAIEAALEAGDMLARLGFDVRVGLLPKGKDPNEVEATEIAHTYYNAIRTNDTKARLLLTRKLG